MHQNPCPEMVSADSNIVKFCKKQPEAGYLTQFEIVKAIYDSGILNKFKLSGSAKLVLIALAHHFNPKKIDMFPSQKYLAQQLGISSKSAERAIRELKTAQLVTYETQRVNHYRFTEKFFESVKMSVHMRQNVGSNDRQNVGLTNKHEQKNNNENKNNFFFNQPKGIEYQPFEPVNYVRDDRTPENDLETAQKFVRQLWTRKDNQIIREKLAKIIDIWGEKNLLF